MGGGKLWLWEEYCLRHGFPDSNAFAKEWQCEDEITICSFELVVQDCHDWSNFLSTLGIEPFDRSYQRRVFQAVPAMESLWERWMSDRWRTFSGTTTTWCTTNILLDLDSWLNDMNSAGEFISVESLRKRLYMTAPPTILGPPVGNIRYMRDFFSGYSVDTEDSSTAQTQFPSASIEAPELSPSISVCVR